MQPLFGIGLRPLFCDQEQTNYRDEATLKPSIADNSKQSVKTTTLTYLGIGILVLSVFTALSISWLQWQDITTVTAASAMAKPTTLTAFPVPERDVHYGYDYHEYEVVTGTIARNQFLSNLLTSEGLGYSRVELLIQNTREVFDSRRMRVGKSYTILKKDGVPVRFIYEPSVYNYIDFDLTGETSAREVRHRVDVKTEEASGVITSSLWNAMVDNDLSYALTARMEDALAWSVDFHHISKNDKFKLVYDKEYIDGKEVGVGQLKAAYFEHNGQAYHAFYFKGEQHEGYFDLEARPMKKTFLKSPVKFARMTSAYNLRRFHPVLRRRKPHLGTDYAAPRGTPILATADGVITKRARTRGNGNYIKMRHDRTYETQYLHMSRFAKGVTVGTRVKQGDVIGYIGSTGLATGPHVCYRFWKNGKQVDPRREKMPQPEPLPASERAAFDLLKVQLQAQLDNIAYKDIPEQAAAKRKDP